MLENLTPSRVFHYFEEISSIPRGSGNTKKITQYCESFAKEHSLSHITDSCGNVIIKKPASVGFEKREPVILQGHLDMVCQKDEGFEINFDSEGISLITDGDFIRAHHTTLGADNGIAVAIVLAILESNELSHPPIEAVFTVDEEIGMIGALKLDMSLLKGRKMINLDSEEDSVTVSCAGGRDITAEIPFTLKEKQGTELVLTVKGLKGGHSGIAINDGRVNADMLAGRILHSLSSDCPFDIIEINGGSKANAIPNMCTVRLCVEDDGTLFSSTAEKLICGIKAELSHREPSFSVDISKKESSVFSVIDSDAKNKLILSLICTPNGVMEMSKEIDGLVETSLNLGILKTESGKITLCHSLRSNKKTALSFLSERLIAFYSSINAKCTSSGDYPPWEFNDNSSLCTLYCKIYEKHCGKAPSVEAIHAGLECGVFSSSIEGLDCIAVGPTITGAHTTEEKLSISSVKTLYDILADVLKSL